MAILRVYNIERNLNTPAKFLYPNYETLYWLAAAPLIQEVNSRYSLHLSENEYSNSLDNLYVSFCPLNLYLFSYETFKKRKVSRVSGART